MEIRKLFIGFMLVAFFVIAIVMFGSKFGEENQAQVNLINDSRVNVLYSGVNSTLYDYGGKGIQETANDSVTAFNKDNVGITGGLSELFFNAVTGVGKSIMGVANSIFNVTWDPLLKMVGLPRDARVLIGTIITSILLFSITLLAWKVYKQGQ